MTDHRDLPYDDSNRAFAQAFLARGTLTLDEAQRILASILTVHERRQTLPEDITEAVFHSYMTAAKEAISPFDLEIRGTYHQLSRQRIYALVNTTSDPLVQLATSYTPDEISFLKRVLDAMFDTYNTSRHEIMAITPMQAVQLHKAPSTSGRRESQAGSVSQGSGGQSLTMVQAERMLASLVQEGWFDKSTKGYYSLSPRALMELRGWLVETYNDVDDEDDEEGDADATGGIDRPRGRRLKIKQCFACKEIITAGQRCPKLGCSCRLHDICTTNFFRVHRSDKCPLCGTVWNDPAIQYVGERVATAADSRLQASRQKKGIRGITGPSSRSAAPAAAAATDTDSDVTDESAPER